MAQNRDIDFIDLLIILLNKKKILLIFLILTFVISYGSIYLLIDNEYESTGLFLPETKNTLGGLMSLSKNLKDLPLGLGGLGSSSESDLYTTLIYSRSSLENIIKQFHLQEDYNQPSMDKAVRRLKSSIDADVDDQNAYFISVRASSPWKASAIVNHLLDYVNKMVIDINTAKSKANREFLEARYSEIVQNLKSAEDSLEDFQKSSKLLEVKEQLKLTYGAYAEFEKQVVAKRFEVKLLEKLYQGENPQVELVKNQLKDYESQLKSLKTGGDNESMLVALNSLPEKTKAYLRLYRDVEIFSKILEFLVPMYEQAKFEEKNDIPVIQILDRGNIPEKKIYPPRLLFSSLASVIILFILSFYFIVIELSSKSNNPKVQLLRENFRISKKAVK